MTNYNDVMVEKGNSISIGAIVALVAGFVALLYTFYFMQQLSYSVGVYSGISSAIRTYNINNANVSNVLISAISQSTTLLLALRLTYALLPFAVIMLAISTIWLFNRSYFRFAGMALIISSLIYVIIVAVIEFDFIFNNTMYSFPFAYAAGGLALAVGTYSLLRLERPHQLQRRTVHPILINPETPYSNIKMLSKRLMRNLNGDIRILDMHFDINALDNLGKLVIGNTQYSSISVLTSASRLGNEFYRYYNDFKNELSNNNINFELRVLANDEASKQHERLLMDSSTAYKIPPLNIINKKSEHIVGINHREAEYRFNNLWPKATKYENMKRQQQ